MRFVRRGFASTLLSLLGMVAVMVGPAPTANSQEVTRVHGDTRITTAIAVAERHWDAASTVVLATSVNYPDALAAAAVAALHDAPLLLTPGSALPGTVADELVRLSAGEVIIMGGTAAVSPTVERQVEELPTRPDVRRIAGVTRVETAAAAARAAGAPSGEAVVASAANFPDALAAGSLTATPDRLPVLLAQRDSVPPVTMAALHDLGVEHVTLIGGSAVLSDAAVEQLQREGLAVTRRSGSDRFATAAVVVEDALQRFGGEPRPLVAATGQNFPDALAAGALAARLEAPLLLVPRAGLGDALAQFIRERRDRFARGLVVGGPGAVSDTTVAELGAALAGDEPSPPPEEPPPPEDPPPPEQGEFGDGTWRVPEEVEPGLYRNTDSSDSCYWERLEGFSGEFDDVIANGFSEEIFIVEIKSSDAGFRSERCGRWSSDLSPRTSSSTADFGGGHHQVGVEIAPGTWRNSDSSEHCYWERLRGFSGEFDDVIANGFSESVQTVTIAEDDVGFWSERCGTWTRIG